jgi:uncharacterized protein YceK
MKLILALIAVLALSGCAALVPVIGSLTAGGFGASAISSAGGVVGGEVAKNELQWFKQWRVCRRQYRTSGARKACMERYRTTQYGARYR